MKNAQDACLGGRGSNRLTLTRAAAAVGATAALSLVHALPAGASTPTGASGEFSFTSDLQTPSALHGPNTVVSEVATLVYTGDLAGAATDTDTFVVHADGSFEGHGTEVCNQCTLWGLTGSFTGTFTFRGAGDSYVGHETVVGAAGGLAGLHGGGTFRGLVVENVNSYSYMLHLG